MSTDLDGLWRGLNNYVFVFKNKKDLIKWFGPVGDAVSYGGWGV